MTNQVISEITNSLSAILRFIPNIFVALGIFVLGWLVAGVARRLTLQILKIVQLEPFAEKVGLSENLRKLGSTVSPAELIADLIKWTVVIVFLSPASDILGLEQIAYLVTRLLSYIPNVVVAVVIVMFGAIIADLSADFVRSAAVALSSSTSNFLASLARYSILAFSILAALSQLRIAANLINTLFTGFVAMIALAGGLAFGLGGKDMAGEILEDVRNSLSEKEKY
ncbi:hypothetical protein KJ596_02745 [Patescibacteria group bacterium]|nr:hypothetical protein [Patescibacteria group bacterium]MBU1868447.1 hypothetical protein [Patescibacteria group bacterium]